MANPNKNIGMFSIEMLPPEIKALIKDLPPEQQLIVAQKWVENQALNTQAGPNTPPLSPAPRGQAFPPLNPRF